MFRVILLFTVPIQEKKIVIIIFFTGNILLIPARAFLEFYGLNGFSRGRRADGLGCVETRAYISSRLLYVSLRITVIPGDGFEGLAKELLQTPSERYSTHRVQQKINAEIRVVQKHEELLNAPHK